MDKAVGELEASAFLATVWKSLSIQRPCSGLPQVQSAQQRAANGQPREGAEEDTNCYVGGPTH